MVEVNGKLVMDQFNAAFIERVTQDTLMGLETYFRDANLSQEVFSKYKPGIVIQETGFVDVSELEGKPAAQVRYQIFTSKSQTSKESFAMYGAWTMPRGCYFKVVDVYVHDHFALITLLHIPTYTVPFFAQNHHPEEDAITLESRKRFEGALLEDTLEAIADEYWRRRTAFPIGIDD